MFPFGFGIRHTGTHPGADHGQFQLTEYPGDLQEGFCHRVHLPIPAVHSNTADNNQPQPFVPDHIDDLTKLLCRTGQPGDFQCDNSISGMGLSQHERLLLLGDAVPMFILQPYPVYPQLFQLSDLPVDILPVLVCTASGVAMCNGKGAFIFRDRFHPFYPLSGP